MKPKDLIQLAILAALIWFSVIAPRLDKSNPPIITAGPTQPAPVIAATQPAPVIDVPNFDTMNTAAAATVQAMQQPAAGQLPATDTPGPTLNEVLNHPAGGNPFVGNVTVIPNP
jgi:hypothetical protein